MAGKIDPMHQFTVEPLVPLHIGRYDISLTNSAAWMLAALVVIGLFMWGGMKRQIVPGRWQMAVEGLTDFDQALQLWRWRHLILVYRIIGAGTPSLKGKPVDLLERGVKERFFPELWQVRDELFAEWTAKAKRDMGYH